MNGNTTDGRQGKGNHLQGTRTYHLDTGHGMDCTSSGEIDVKENYGGKILGNLHGVPISLGHPSGTQSLGMLEIYQRVGPMSFIFGNWYVQNKT